MPEIRTKSTDDSWAEGDGIRIFVTRYWPRGHGREECDEWMPNLAPSQRLLRDFQDGAISWARFRIRYRIQMLKGYGSEEGENPRMRDSGQKYVLRFLKFIAETRRVTLLCTCPPDQDRCHRILLKDLIEKS